MADVTISQLTNRQPTGAAVVPYSEGGTTYNASVNQIVSLASSIPQGGIILWSGLLTAIPSGWALCDGQGGRPDLRSRFIVGAGQGTGLTNYSVGAIGGSETVSLNIAQMPAHDHGVSFGWHSNYGASPSCGGNGAFAGSSRCNLSENVGGGQAHENRPPYYALAYIIKL